MPAAASGDEGERGGGKGERRKKGKGSKRAKGGEGEDAPADNWLVNEEEEMQEQQEEAQRAESEEEEEEMEEEGEPEEKGMDTGRKGPGKRPRLEADSDTGKRGEDAQEWEGNEHSGAVKGRRRLEKKEAAPSVDEAAGFAEDDMGEEGEPGFQDDDVGDAPAPVSKRKRQLSDSDEES